MRYWMYLNQRCKTMLRVVCAPISGTSGRPKDFSRSPRGSNISASYAAEREESDLDLLSLGSYSQLLFDRAAKDAFLDWPWDQSETKSLLDIVIAPVRDSTAHGTTQAEALNSEIALL